MSTEYDNNALPPGYPLHWYEIVDVIGRGGFGITYLARDNNLDMQVAIKEYLPEDFSSRKENSAVQPRTARQADLYQWGLERFVAEARILARFTHPNIVRVLSVFEHNNTAYMVMEYAQGEDLSTVYRRHRKAGQPLTEQDYLDIFIPICDGLSLVHREGFIHRDIKPANIYLCNEAQPLLLDFGSARQSVEHKTRALTSLVTVGYAPFEQYQEGTGKQGAWTDIYSLGASIYVGIAGEKPADAMARGSQLLDTNQDPYKPLSQIATGQFSEHFLRAVDHALMFRPEDRPGHILRWADMLMGHIEVPPIPEDRYAPVDEAELEKTVVRPVNSTGPRTDDRNSARSARSARSLPPTTAPSRGSQGLVDSLGRRLAGLGQKVEQPVEAGFVRLWKVLGEAAEKARQRITRLPTNGLIGAAAVMLVIVVALALLPGETDDAEPDDLSSVAPAAGNSPPQAPQPDPQQHLADRLARAQAAYVSGNTDTAAKLIDDILAIEPGHQNARVLKEKIEARLQRRQRIESLLADASGFMEDGALVEPEGNNAHDRYKRVLELDNANTAARQGIQRIAERLMADAQTAYKSARHADALAILEQIERIGALDAEATSLKQQAKQGITQKQRIASLLAEARQHIGGHRYTTPADRNALDTYQKVLALDPGNTQARSGIANIKKIYKRQFDRFIAKKDTAAAASSLKKLTNVDPHAPELARMKQTLDRTRAMQKRKMPSDIDRVSALISEYKTALETKDLGKLRRISRFQPGREAFLRNLFGRYKDFSVTISGFEYVGKERRATATVKIADMIDKNNQVVMPGDWSKFSIDTRRDNRNRLFVHW